MRTLYIDTVSTTGVWLWKLPEDDEAQPHLIRVAVIMDDDESDSGFSLCQLCQLRDTWPPIGEDSDRHGIHDGDLSLHGLPLERVLAGIAPVLTSVDMIVMQNARFHLNMLQRAFRDVGQEMPDISAIKTFDTMIRAKDVIRTSKWVGLGESYRYFAGEALVLPSDPIARGRTVINAVQLVHCGIIEVERSR